MAAAKPSDIQGLVIAVMMRINRCDAADLAEALCQLPRAQRLLDREMRTVLQRVRSAPMGLASVTFQHADAFECHKDIATLVLCAGRVTLGPSNHFAFAFR